MNILITGTSSGLGKEIFNELKKDKKIFFFSKFKIFRLLDKLFNFFLNNKLFKSSIIQLYKSCGRHFELSSLRRLSRDIPLVLRLLNYWSMTGYSAHQRKCD